jgi:hypothetical protein
MRSKSSGIASQTSRPALLKARKVGRSLSCLYKLTANLIARDRQTNFGSLDLVTLCSRQTSGYGARDSRCWHRILRREVYEGRGDILQLQDRGTRQEYQGSGDHHQWQGEQPSHGRRGLEAEDAHEPAKWAGQFWSQMMNTRRMFFAEAPHTIKMICDNECECELIAGCRNSRAIVARRDISSHRKVLAEVAGSALPASIATEEQPSRIVKLLSCVLAYVHECALVHLVLARCLCEEPILLPRQYLHPTKYWH